MTDFVGSRILATISGLGSVVTLWDTKDWTVIKEFKRYSGAYAFNSLAFLPEGSLLTAAPIGDYSKGINFEDDSAKNQKYKTLEIFSLIQWNPETGKPIRYIPELGYPPKDSSTKITDTFAASKDGLLIAGTGGREILLYETKNGTLVRKLPISQILGHPDHAMSVAFSPNGQELAVGTLSGTVHFFNLQTSKLTSSITAYPPPWYGCSTLAYSPDGKYLAVGRHNGFAGQLINGVWTNRTPDTVAVTIWRTSDDTLVSSLPGSIWKLNGSDDASDVNSLSWSPDGRMLAVGAAGDGQALRLWRIDEENPELLINSEFPKGVYSVSFSSQGILAATENNEVIVYK